MKASELLPSVKTHPVVAYQGTSSNQDGSDYLIDAYYCQGCGHHLGPLSELETGMRVHADDMAARARRADSRPLLEVALEEAQARTPGSPELWALLSLLVNEVRSLKTGQ